MAFAQVEVPPKKFIFYTNVANLMPKYSHHYGEGNIGFEYYAGKQISVGLNGGLFYRYNFGDTLIQDDFLSNVTTTNVFGGSFSIDFKRFIPEKLSTYKGVRALNYYQAICNIEKETVNKKLWVQVFSCLIFP